MTNRLGAQRWEPGDRFDPPLFKKPFAIRTLYNDLHQSMLRMRHHFGLNFWKSLWTVRWEGTHSEMAFEGLGIFIKSGQVMSERQNDVEHDSDLGAFFLPGKPVNFAYKGKPLKGQVPPHPTTIHQARVVHHLCGRPETALTHHLLKTCSQSELRSMIRTRKSFD